MKSKKAQVWVETVVYTLIAFAMIGLVLSFVKPKIEENKDRSILEQSIGIIESTDYLIEEIRGVPGNQRVLDLSIKEGSLTIDSEKDRIFFEMESNYKYSEPGTSINEGDLVIHTREKGKVYLVNVTQNYENYNITFDGKNDEKKLHAAPSKYNLIIANEGEDSDKNTIINFELK